MKEPCFHFSDLYVLVFLFFNFLFVFSFSSIDRSVEIEVLWDFLKSLRVSMWKQSNYVLFNNWSWMPIMIAVIVILYFDHVSLYSYMLCDTETQLLIILYDINNAICAFPTYMISDISPRLVISTGIYETSQEQKYILYIWCISYKLRQKHKHKVFHSTHFSTAFYLVKTVVSAITLL